MKALDVIGLARRRGHGAHRRDHLLHPVAGYHLSPSDDGEATAVLLAVTGPWRDGFVALAGLGAGIVNGIAGGGTLVSFPVLLAVGVPALRANVTSTVGIFPGYLGGVAGFRPRSRTKQTGCERSRRSPWPAASAGAVLLLVTPSSAFSRAAPYLILARLRSVRISAVSCQDVSSVRAVGAGGSGTGRGPRRLRLRLVLRRRPRRAAARGARHRDARPVGPHERAAIRDLARGQHDRSGRLRDCRPRGVGVRGPPRSDKPGRRLCRRQVRAQGSRTGPCGS